MSLENAALEFQRVSSVVAALARSLGLRTAFAASDSLVDGGFTSVAMVELMLAVELEFDMMIPNRELNASNFSSIQSLASLMGRLQNGALASIHGH